MVEFTPEQKEKRRQYSRKYHAKNRDKKMEKIQCECGQMVTRGGMWDHKRRSRHRNNMIAIEFMKLKKQCEPCKILVAETVKA